MILVRTETLRPGERRNTCFRRALPSAGRVTCLASHLHSLSEGCSAIRICEANEHRSRRLTSTECAFVEFAKRLGIAGGILKPVHMA
jgi:hypothetical protein